MQIEDCTNMGWHERVGIQLGQNRAGYNSLSLTAEQIDYAHKFATRELLDEIHTMLWHLCKAQGLPVYERWPKEPAKTGPAVATPLRRCAAARDGDCIHPDCPQLRDGEPAKSGRHCPLDTDDED